MPPIAAIRSRSHRFRRVLPALLIAMASAPVAAAPPEVTFEPGALIVSGLSPGGEVIVHGITRERQPYFWRLLPTREVLVADGAGAARLEQPESPGAVRSLAVWSVVDAATGELTIASPEGSNAEEIVFPADGLGRSETGALRVLRSQFERAEVLYVRPGVGAWWLLASDGSAVDHDRREDSRLALSLEDAQTFWGTEPPPEEFAAGDVVVAVNLDTLAYFAARLVAPGRPK